MHTSPQNGGLAIDYVSPECLIVDPQNPRVHKPPQIAAIARSIQTFGFNVPVVANSEGVIIAGHGRVAAAIKLGLEVLPVVRIDHLSTAQRKAFAIADNRLTDSSHWDERLLGEVLYDLSLAELDFELDAIGFSVCEIGLKIEAITTVGEECSDKDDERIELAAGAAITRTGDLWRLGKHRLLCGDALDAQSWSVLMDSHKAHMVFTDPPYNLRADYIGGLGKIRHRDFGQAAGEMDRDEFTAFLTDVFRQMASNLEPGALAYVFMDHRHLTEMMAAGEASFRQFKTLCAWVKPSGAMGGLYRNQMELVFVWQATRGRHRDNVKLGKFGRNRTNVWEYAAIGSFRHSEGGDLLASHPTCKPVKLAADAILDVTARGDIVVDPFMGSGTTIIAAERVGRTAYGMELDPVYCDATLRRYRNLTGDEPILISTDQTFAALEAERGGDTE